MYDLWAQILCQIHKYMKDNDSSERHQNNALKVIIAYAKYFQHVIA
jgi:hypothetical protein